ncbi:hypothetical protein NLI96_g8148 [Meripilus lineatus]|uniref:Uncharacterized protein n=1 Tax=Meripilus lineatus TaxID=2056292 RepID=A0AAD5UZG4_9APHY|nr:hypothetical protein NLI96_g8148 [Physisporinus lineatus]
MVRLLLSIKAELENVTDLAPASEDFEYFFKEEREVSGGKGNTAHFVWRCSLCKRESSAKFEANSPPVPYTLERNGQLAPFVTIDCRGLEFIDFDPRGVWKCVGAESGTSFPEAELQEGEWVDYDEKAALPVGVSNIECDWSRA